MTARTSPSQALRALMARSGGSYLLEVKLPGVTLATNETFQETGDLPKRLAPLFEQRARAAGGRVRP